MRPAPLGRALTVWACAMTAYVCAVAGRTSLGVAGVEAMARFDMPATMLAVFSSIQVGVYGLAQVPVGLALDRWGPRRLLTTGAVLVALAQVAMAFSSSVPTALAARVLLGVGDATAFVSVLRLLPSWFSPFRIPLFTQLTSIVGMLGQVISAVPFMGVLHRAGWSPAFAIMAGFGFAVSLLVAALVRDTPDEGAPVGVPVREVAPSADGRGRVAATLRDVVSSPWTWLGFFTHWTGAGPSMVFTLLWGVPFMTLGMGMPKAQASGALLLLTVANILMGPLVGQFTARRPRGRLPAVAAVAVLVLVCWVVVLAPAAPPGPWAAQLLAVVLAAAGVSSSIAFDFVRQGVSREHLGTAIGATNMGGFLSTLIAVQAIGMVLDGVSSGRDYVWADFRIAMSVQLATWVVGMVGLGLAALGTRSVPARTE